MVGLAELRGGHRNYHFWGHRNYHFYESEEFDYVRLFSKRENPQIKEHRKKFEFVLWDVEERVFPHTHIYWVSATGWTILGEKLSPLIDKLTYKTEAERLVLVETMKESFLIISYLSILVAMILLIRK